MAFAVPADWEGITIVNAAYSPRERKKLDCALRQMGIPSFDDHLRPRLRPLGAGIPLRRRPNWPGNGPSLCPVPPPQLYGLQGRLSEILTGATALAAEYNGIDNAQHVRHQLAEMIQVVDLFLPPASPRDHGIKAASGTYIPTPTIAMPGECWPGRPFTGNMRPWPRSPGGSRRRCPGKRTSPMRRRGPIQ